MKRGIVATLGLAFAVVVGLGLFGSAVHVSANHAPDPDEITISSAQANTAVPVGSVVTVKLAVTTSTAPYQSIQWEMAYTQNLSFVLAGSSAVYDCQNPVGVNLPSPLNTTPPAESVLLPGVLNNLGAGSNCATLANPYAGTNDLGTFVTVKLLCVAPGQALVGLRPGSPAYAANPLYDASFGTALGDPAGAVIPTTLENEITVPAIPPFPSFQSPGFGLVCGTTNIDFSVTKTGPASAAIGDTGSYTVTVNNPDSVAHILTVNDPTPSGVTLGVPSAPCAGGFPCTQSFAPGATIITVPVAFDGCGSKVNTASIALPNTPFPQQVFDVYDPINFLGGGVNKFGPSNNTASATTAVSCPTLLKTVSDPISYVGDPITYTLTAGGYSTANPVAVTVVDVLAAGQTFVSGAGCSGVTTITCTGNTAAGSIVFNALVTSSTSGSKTNAATANPGGATAGATVTVLPLTMSITKTCTVTSSFTDDPVNCTVIVTNTSALTGTTPGLLNPVVTDTITGGGVLGAGSDVLCTGTNVVTCTGPALAPGASHSYLIIETMPSVAGTVCDTASVTAPPAASVNTNATPRCVTVISKFPTVNGVTKDTGVTPTISGPLPKESLCDGVDNDNDGVVDDGCLDPNFQFSLGNLFLCKGTVDPANLPTVGAFSGAGQSACNIFKMAEIVQADIDSDTCNDDNDNDGRPCAGANAESGAQCANATDDPTGIPSGVGTVLDGFVNAGCPAVGAAEAGTQCNDANDDDADGAVNDGCPGGARASWQDLADQCRDVATDYIPGQTLVDCNGGETAEGLGAAEFQVKFDDKLFTSPTFDCSVRPDGDPAILATGTRVLQAQVSIITENWVQFGCITKNPGGQNPTITNGPNIESGAVVLGTLTFTLQNDLFSRIRPAKDNGVSTNLLDENCETADTLGQPMSQTNGTYGANYSPSGGLSKDCKDAALTIRMLEGDINLDCQVDVSDDQGIAFRYGQFFGQLNYNRFYDLEPNIAPDFDIDIKDVQTVFGRNGSTCRNPIPAQPPLTTIPDP